MVINDLSDSPVLALEHNITAAFESFERHLAGAVAAGTLHHEMLLDVEAAVPRTPYITRAGLQPPQIHAQVAHLELLWAFIYAWMAIYEETVQKAQLNGLEVGETDGTNESLVARAEALLVWARGLSTRYTPWPADLPSPRHQSSGCETYYAEKANYVFERATSFLLCHEHAHAAYRHFDVVGQGGSSGPVRQELENEADQRAFERLVDPSAPDEAKAAEAWAVISVMLSSLYVMPDPTVALRASSHPALHHRLAHLMRSLDFSGARYRYYFHLLCRVVLQDVFPNLARPGQHSEDAAEALEAALDDLDEGKV